MHDIYDLNYCRKTADRVSFISIAVNIFLSLLKLAAGLIFNLSSLISDAVHSASDVFSTFIVIYGIHASSKAADKEHEYGHERFECLAAVVLAVILFITGLYIGFGGLKGIFSENDVHAVPGKTAVFIAAASIFAKEIMYRYTYKCALEIKSSALAADAWHHRSDALSSVGALFGAVGTWLGYPVCDPAASVIICFFIIKAAYDIFCEAADKLTDKGCSPEIEEQIRSAVLSGEGVKRIDLIKTRQFGSRVYADIEIAADGSITLSEAHKIAEAVHDAAEKAVPEMKHCMVHVNPV